MSRVELEVGERRQDNGLVLLAVRNRGVPTFAAEVFFDAGMRVEGKGEEGLANLTGTCLEEGTKRRSGMGLAGAIEDIGGALEAGGCGGAVHCPAEVSGRGLRLLAEMITEPAFPSAEVERVRQEVLTEIRADQDDPGRVAGLRFRKEVYGAHPYARPAKGRRATVRKFRPVDLRRFHRRWFVAQSCLVAASSPAPIEETLDVLEAAFSQVRGKRPAFAPPKAPPLPRSCREIHLPMPREQVHVVVGHPGIRRTDPDFHALLVLDHILGSGPGFTSRIARRLRDEMGLCYSVHAGITDSAAEEPGCFTATIATSKEHRRAAIDGFVQEIERIRDTVASEQELRDVQDYLTGSFVFAFERNSRLASYAITVKRFALGFDYVQKYPDLISAVTRDDLRRVARAHLHPDRLVIVSAGAGA